MTLPAVLIQHMCIRVSEGGVLPRSVRSIFPHDADCALWAGGDGAGPHLGVIHHCQCSRHPRPSREHVSLPLCHSQKVRWGVPGLHYATCAYVTPLPPPPPPPPPQDSERGDRLPLCQQPSHICSSHGAAPTNSALLDSELGPGASVRAGCFHCSVLAPTQSLLGLQAVDTMKRT